MSYLEVDCNYCRSCYIKLRKPSKKAQKRLILTTYEDFCECCGKPQRLVEYTWENDEDDN